MTPILKNWLLTIRNIVLFGKTVIVDDEDNSVLYTGKITKIDTRFTVRKIIITITGIYDV